MIVLFTYLFHKLANSVSQENITMLDRILMEWTNYQSFFLTLVFESMTIFGSVWWIGSISFIIVLVFWIKKLWWSVFAFSTAMIGGVFLNIILKTMYQRSRPMEMESLEVLGISIESVAYSFPSGHAMRAFIFYGLIMYWFLFIGGSRIYLSAHYPTDVLAGYAISLAW
jgi:undecaprenyl-diphosphatase